MADWTLIYCLVLLRAEFTLIAPGRDKASDGSIGDTAHQEEVSDHNPDETGSVPIRDADRVNEVHAIDVDSDLRTPGLTMEMVVQFLLGRCRSGAEKRLRYIIFNRRIWEASNDWRQRTYTGPSPHTEHAHFSASYTTALEASTASWHLEDLMAALTADETRKIVREELAAFAKIDPLASMLARSAEQRGRMTTALAQLAELSGKDMVNEPAIVAGVLAGLSPEAIAAAIPTALADQVAQKLADRLAS